jgi:hypothetical protein
LQAQIAAQVSKGKRGQLEKQAQLEEIERKIAED